jgi:Domain of unknown function (DUF6456)
MSDTATTDSFSRSERKLLARLLRVLLRGPAPCVATPEGDLRATMLQVAAEGKTLALPAALAERAARRGLITVLPDRLMARPEAAAHLRRLLCEVPDEPFAEQHRDVVADQVIIDQARQPVRRNLAESPLSGLSRLKDRDGGAFLPPDAVEAGERLAVDFERGQLQPSVTSRWEPRIDSATPGLRAGKLDLSDSAMAARSRIAKAVDAMGPELSGVALDICCFGKGLELVERERGWPARSAKLMLRTALLSLARHYAPPAPRSRGAHRWGAEGYRPEL